MGLTVSILAAIVAAQTLLVTALIGWQIYNVIFFDEKIKKSEKRIKKEFDKEITYKSNELEAKVLGTSGLIFYRTKAYTEAFGCCILAIEILLKENDNINIDILLGTLTNTIEQSQRNKYTFIISTEDKEDWIETLSDVGYKKTKHLLDFVETITPKD